MKLKQLHIRNIASIERADIDFENGLNDPITGLPASIFLISGDTGAGKSVILDCISMALYKKTPRIADVANSSKNDFTDAEGESIRVASIEQYTRLGISEKDDSYSEVVFEGNDGKTYHARLTLGMAKGRGKTKSGIRQLKHKSPKWEICIGNGDWTKDSVEPTVCQAVGLDFQQFGRMAMLAQGQFANFLTGDKKEREAILEQLTNTQHFTAYGEAIQSLWKQAKDYLSVIQTQYDTEKPHTLSEEEVEQIANELQTCRSEIERFSDEIKTIEQRLKLTETVLVNDQRLAEADQQRQVLEARMEGDDYRQGKTLFTDWDATTTQRGWLADLMKARKDEAKAHDGLDELRPTFALLVADLADRQLQVESLGKTVGLVQEWLSQRNQHEALFGKVDGIEWKIGQYEVKQKKAAEQNVLLEEERKRTAKLKEAAQNALGTAEKAAMLVKEQQDKIDLLNRKRTELNPQRVTDELKTLNARKQLLVSLQTDISNLAPLQETAHQLQSEILAEEQDLNRLKEIQEKADADFLLKTQEAEQAVKRFTTMKMSLDKKIKELRHRLYEEHTVYCPLCGQHIEHICIDDDFKDMLTPLQEDEQRTAKALRLATDNRDKALGELKQLDGIHKSKLSRQQDLSRQIEDALKNIARQADTLGLDTQSDLAEQMQQATGLLTSDIVRLESLQHQAESLQTEINRLVEAKKPFDKQKTAADVAVVRAENEVRSNTLSITQIAERLQGLQQECETLKTDISTSLAGYCDDWQSDSSTLCRQLKADAQVYHDQEKRLSEALASQERAATLVSSLQHLQQDVLRICPSWELSSAPEAYPCRDIQTEWSRLLGKVTSLVSKVRDCRNVITSSADALTAYYEETGKTEQSLLTLMGQESQVRAARRLVTETDAQWQSRKDAMTEARGQIDVALAELGIEDQGLLQDKQMLQNQKSTVSFQRDEMVSKMAQAKSRLDTHKANIMRLKEIEAELEKSRQRFQRWERLNSIFGGTRFRTLVQTYILRPLLNNANIYLEQITDRYRLTCNETNEQLSILVLDRYNKNQVRSVTVLSGGERFMISLALSLALSSLNRPDMNVNILFIDEGFGTLDEKSLDSVMSTLEKLQEIAGQTNRRVGIISHREELEERIPVKIQVVKKGEGRSQVVLS